MSGIRRHHFHLFPVIRKLSAAIQAYDVGAGEGSRFNAAETGTNCNGKTVTSVPAAEKHVEQLRDHNRPPPQRALSGPYLGLTKLLLRQTYRTLLCFPKASAT